jgi:hypothetical protein
MPARIYRLLADELDISEDRAQKLLRAMMREVQKRSRRGGGIRIPDLGSFVVRDGELTFSPSDSLARAVNQEYEGLAEEDLSTADPEPASKEENQGPTTITTGFHRSVTPDRGSGGDSGGSDADTDEFQVPSDPDGADTAEFEAPAEDEPSPSADAETAPASTEDPSAGASDEIRSESSHGGGSSDIDIPSFQPSDSSSPSEPDTSGPSSSAGSSSEASVSESTTSESETSGAASSKTASSEAASSPASAGTESGDAETPAGEESASGAASEESEAARREDPPSGSSSLYEFASQVPGADDPPNQESADGDRPDAAVEESSEAAPSSPDPDDADDDYDESGQIWKSDDPWDFSDESEADEGDAASDASDEPAPAGERPEQTGSSASRDEAADFASPESAFAEEGFEMSSSETSASTEAGDGDAPRDARDEEPGPASEPERSSSASRVLVTAVVLLFLGAAGWFVAGQQGLVPGPTAIVGGGGTPSTGDAAEAAAEGASARETAEPAANQTTDGSASGASAGETAAAGGGAGATDAGSRGFRPGGGWTISVASRTNRTAAESLVERYREEVSGDLPVDIVEATVNGEPRYRVGVGQFASRSAARDAMDTYGDTIPSGAWPIQIP